MKKIIMILLLLLVTNVMYAQCPYEFSKEISKKLNTEEKGFVLVAFNVDTFGNIKNVRIVKSSNEKLNDYVINIVKRMPKWGKQERDQQYYFTIKLL